MKCQEKSPKNMLFEIYRKSPNFLSEQISPAAAYFYDKNRFLSDFNAFLCYMKDFIPIRRILIYKKLENAFFRVSIVIKM